MIEGEGAISTRPRIPEGGHRVFAGAIAAAMTLAACTTSLGTLPRVGPTLHTQGHKMLKPNAAVTECTATGMGTPAGGVEDLLQEALRELLALDDEADGVMNARVQSTWWSVGVYGRRCVTLTGDLVRSTTTILLPMSGGHAEHGNH